MTTTTSGQMSIMPAAAVADRRVSNVTIRVLAALCRHTDKEGTCFPSLNRLAQDLGMKKPNVSRALAKLAECGYVQIEHQYDNETKAQRPSFYRVRFDKPPVITEDNPPLSAEAPNAPKNAPNDNPPLSPVITHRTSQGNVPGERTQGDDLFAADAATQPEQEPSQESETTPDQKTKPTPKPNRLGEIIDLCRDADVPVYPSGRDTKAVKDARASPQQIAEAYIAAWRGEWNPGGNDWLRDQLSLSLVIPRLAGYDAWKRSRNGQARSQRSQAAHSRRPGPLPDTEALKARLGAGRGGGASRTD